MYEARETDAGWAVFNTSAQLFVVDSHTLKPWIYPSEVDATRDVEQWNADLIAWHKARKS